MNPYLTEPEFTLVESQETRPMVNGQLVDKEDWLQVEVDLVQLFQAVSISIDTLDVVRKQLDSLRRSLSERR